jgi:hypothetical protein
MGTGYLLDSNVIIGYLAGGIPPPGMTAVSDIVDATPRISVISQICESFATPLDIEIAMWFDRMQKETEIFGTAASVPPKK